MQAISGAGYPGVASLDILDNVTPHIEWETLKILGGVAEDDQGVKSFDMHSTHPRRATEPRLLTALRAW